MPVAWITEKQFVPAIPRESDGDALTGDLRDEVRRNRGRIRKWLVERIGQQVDHFEHLPGVARLLVMIRFQVTRHDRRVVGLVECRIVEPNRERLHGCCALFLHERDDERRIDPA